MVEQAHVLSSARDTVRSRERRLRNGLIFGVTTGAGATAVIVALLTAVWFVSNRDDKARVSVNQQAAAPITRTSWLDRGLTHKRYAAPPTRRFIDNSRLS
jgi:hypothetical protein